MTTRTFFFVTKKIGGAYKELFLQELLVDKQEGGLDRILELQDFLK